MEDDAIGRSRGTLMLCFEVYLNGEKLCTAGAGDFGVLTAIVTWVKHHPDKLACWRAAGAPETAAEELYLHVGGIGGDAAESVGHLNWENVFLENGDEVRVRIVESPVADPPHRSEPGGPDQPDPAQDRCK